VGDVPASPALSDLQSRVKVAEEMLFQAVEEKKAAVEKERAAFNKVREATTAVYIAEARLATAREELSDSSIGFLGCK